MVASRATRAAPNRRRASSSVTPSPPLRSGAGVSQPCAYGERPLRSAPYHSRAFAGELGDGPLPLLEAALDDRARAGGQPPAGALHAGVVESLQYRRIGRRGQHLHVDRALGPGPQLGDALDDAVA